MPPTLVIHGDQDTLIDQIGWAMSSQLYTDAPATGLPKAPLADSDRTTGCLTDLVAGLQKIVPSQYWSAANPDLTGGIIRYDANGDLVGYVGAAKKPAVYTTADVQQYAQQVQSLSPLTINDAHNSAQQPGTFAYTATYSATTAYSRDSASALQAAICRLIPSGSATDWRA